ncbi:MAG: hypothetical protein NC099_06000 [Corallococcus sp.]|nr:hypothetical protein [Corallococcus sp.]
MKSDITAPSASPAKIKTRNSPLFTARFTAQTAYKAVPKKTASKTIPESLPLNIPKANTYIHVRNNPNAKNTANTQSC